ncbi:MAG TPA: prepilin-type N-terminal cleavage/methylation domain-containing protein [Terriglobales bacterium]
MKLRAKSKSRGFTLMELLISLVVGTIVIGSAVSLFSSAMDATWVENQQAEMQQDLRAASDLLVKDITLAGEGLPLETGIALPSGGGAARPVYGCNQAGACTPTGAINYPYAPTTTVPTMFGIIPGYQMGITPPGSATASDTITVVYADPVLALNCYTISWPASPNLNPVQFTAPVSPPPASCILPANVAFPQGLTDPVYGLKAGDILLFYTQSAYYVGEVTAVAGPASPPAVASAVYDVTFANGDPLELNQTAATSGDLKALIGVAGVSAMRIEVITYYLMNQPDPAGIGTGTPILMRQVNGGTAVPVAENVVNLQFTYDTYNSDGTLLSGAPDGGYSVGDSYNLIRKINVLHLSIRSTMQGARNQMKGKKGFQTLDFQSSVSARDLSYQQRY